MEDLLGTFKIKGDFHDLSKTIRENGVASFVGAVGSPYAWNLHAPSASLEKVGGNVFHFLSIYVDHTNGP